MYTLAQRVAWETRRDVSYAAIGASYVALGGPIIQPVRMLKIVNTTDVTIDISDDGTHDKDIITSGSAFIYDFTSNAASNAGSIFTAAKGTQIYIKGDPSSGSVYMIVIYAAPIGG